MVMIESIQRLGCTTLGSWRAACSLTPATVLTENDLRRHASYCSNRPIERIRSGRGGEHDGSRAERRAQHKLLVWSAPLKVSCELESGLARSTSMMVAAVIRSAPRRCIFELGFVGVRRGARKVYVQQLIHLVVHKKRQRLILSCGTSCCQPEYQRAESKDAELCTRATRASQCAQSTLGRIQHALRPEVR